MTRNQRSRLTLLAVVFACVTTSSALADQVVYFVNGKAMMVKSVEKGDKFTVLEMDGGGRMGVPTDQIVRIEEYSVTPPAPPQPAAPPVAVAPVGLAPAGAPTAPLAGQPGAVATAVQTGPQPPPASPLQAAQGPGVGGRPVVTPGGGLAALKPLEIGGSGETAAAAQRPFPQAMGQQVPAGPGSQLLGGGGPMRRNQFAQGRQFPGRPGMFGGGRGGPNQRMLPLAPTGLNGLPPATQTGTPNGQTAAPAGQATAPTAPTAAPSAQPAPAPAPEEAAPPADESTDDSSTDQSAPPEGEPSGDSPGSQS